MAGERCLIGIPTRQRPDSLRRCVLSHLASAKLHERPRELVVIDDAPTEVEHQEVRQLISDLRREHGGTIALAGLGARQRFVATLAQKSGCAAEVVEFGLLNPEGLPVATGASRNALLLEAAGKLLLQVDDDTEARLAAVPEATTELATATRFDPTEFWFPSDADLEAAAAELPYGDLAGLHEQWLGQTHAGGRVLASMAGVIGDSGMGSSLHFLNLHGQSRDRLLASEATYRAALQTHRVLRAVQQPTLARGAVCMALNLGLDHRELLPPFFPVQRNQDGVFGALLRTCCGGALSVFLPSAVLHLQPGTRLRPLDELDAEVGRLTTGQLVQGLIWTLGPAEGNADTARRLRDVGASLRRLGALPAEAFTDVLTRLVRQMLASLAKQWEASLAQYAEQPSFWATDLRRCLNVLRVRMTAPDCAAPIDLVRLTSTTSALQLFQRLLVKFGQLLEAWPTLVEAARDLRAASVHLAEPT